MTFGQEVRNRRKQKGISQPDFAKRLNMSQSTVSAYENDKQRPRFDQLLLIAKELECKIDDLTNGETV